MAEMHPSLAEENADLRTKLGRAYQEYAKLRKAYKELESDWKILHEYKRKEETRIGALNERHNREIERLRAKDKRMDVLTAVFSAMGGFGACAVIVWALVQFGGR